MTVLIRLTSSGRFCSISMEWNMRYIFIGGLPSEAFARAAATHLAARLGRQPIWRNT